MDLSHVESQFASAWPPESWCDAHCVLAVSSGADSVAMLRAAIALRARLPAKGEIIIAHLNHALRGGESDGDQQWLEALCGKLNLPLETAKVDVKSIAAQRSGSLEAIARQVRYEFLVDVAKRRGARFVATAHNADDQVETVLHRIVRGTGLAGLAGIPSLRLLSPDVALVRPMLGIRRTEVLEYLAAIGQDYRVDTTNQDRCFTRNRLRHELLPDLRQFNHAIDVALLRLAQQANEAQQIVVSAAAELGPRAITIGSGIVEIQTQALLEQPDIVVREVCKMAWKDAGWPLQSMGFHEWQLLATLAAENPETTSANLPYGVRARREGDVLVLERAVLS